MGQYDLKPIERKKPAKFKKFGVLDIESQDWIEFVSVGCFDHRGFEVFDYHSNGIEELFEWVFDEQCDITVSEDEGYENDPTLIYFAHFAGKFDFLFFLQYFFKSSKYKFISGIPRGSMILTYSVSYKDIKIQFWDSCALLPFALRTLTKNFNVVSLKGDIDYNFIRHSYDNVDYSNDLFDLILKDEDERLRYVPKFIVFYDGVEVREYPKNYNKDLITYYVKEDFDLWNEKKDKKEKDKPTLHHIYSKHEHIAYLKNDCEGLHQVLTKFYNWPLIRKAGQSFTIASQALKIYRTFLKENIPALDEVDDEFCRESYFGGRTEIFKHFFKDHIKFLFCHDANSLYPYAMKTFDYPLHPIGKLKEFKKDILAIYHCKVSVPKMHVPPLPVKHDGKLIFPTGIFSGFWVGSELQMAIEHGCKILEVYDGIEFSNGGRIFAEYIDTLYKIRLEKGGESVDGILAKLIMNSSYGKFGQGSEKENLGWEDGEDPTEVPFHDFEMDDGKVYTLCKKTVNLRSFSNVAIASFVTSYARQVMYPYYVKCGKEIYYTDTDSIYSTIDFGSTKELGGLKEEERTHEACFLLPKTYITDAKLKMKGFEKKTLKFTDEDFLNALQGELGILKTVVKSRPMTFKQALSRKGEVLALSPQSTKEIKSFYNKRKVIKKGNVLDWTTEAWNLKE